MTGPTDVERLVTVLTRKQLQVPHHHDPERFVGDRLVATVAGIITTTIADYDLLRTGRVTLAELESEVQP